MIRVVREIRVIRLIDQGHKAIVSKMTIVEILA